MLQYGPYIMIFGVLLQVTAFKGHEAGAQFLIGRIITGVGNGMVSQSDLLVISYRIPLDCWCETQSPSQSPQ